MEPLEVRLAPATITTLASFNTTTGEPAIAGVVEDSRGNIFGTNVGGGASFDGTM